MVSFYASWQGYLYYYTEHMQISLKTKIMQEAETLPFDVDIVSSTWGWKGGEKN